MTITQLAKANLDRLKNNVYPGRGIIIGMSPDEKHYIQVYWIMGRSSNSRNRIFQEIGKLVETKAFDDSKLEDPSLIIYNCIKVHKTCHLVANGDQSDTITDLFDQGYTFEAALKTRCYEPDAPNFTPRISGVVDVNSKSYQLSILKSVHNNGLYHAKQFFDYGNFIPGFGHCIHTYKSDGNPIPSFAGEPYLLPMGNDIETLANNYWDALNQDNKVALLVKFIDVKSSEYQVKIINKLK